MRHIELQIWRNVINNGGGGGSANNPIELVLLDSNSVHVIGRLLDMDGDGKHVALRISDKGVSSKVVSKAKTSIVVSNKIDELVSSKGGVEVIDIHGMEEDDLGDHRSDGFVSGMRMETNDMVVGGGVTTVDESEWWSLTAVYASLLAAKRKGDFNAIFRSEERVGGSVHTSGVSCSLGTYWFGPLPHSLQVDL
ncbi:hypothetical protein V6N11_009403 [Hibiscus sabdariffa]|uniref:Uncharacterized protein n=1 Tax=Hibiscus sabdariffa TaxID=183260 RepID=A0ABR2NSS0_9ROSI